MQAPTVISMLARCQMISLVTYSNLAELAATKPILAVNFGIRVLHGRKRKTGRIQRTRDCAASRRGNQADDCDATEASLGNESRQIRREKEEADSNEGLKMVGASIVANEKNPVRD
jgi:hypothetical protein